MSGKMRRRRFLEQASLLTAGSLALAGWQNHEKKLNSMDDQMKERFKPITQMGLGGVAIGNGFAVHPDVECLETMQAAWDAGVRYYDTSPWYGLGISERRMGLFLKDKPRESFTISTKIGRILEPKDDFKLPGIWKGRLNFSYKYDYTASGTRRSVEDSLQRMGLSAIDIVFIHDLSPDNEDMKDEWVDYFKIAESGAMKELTKMREEGIIKAWGFGVNTLEPILKAIEVADPDIFLSAIQYSLLKHEDALHRLFPVCEKRNISLVIGGPYNSGLLAGKPRYNYSDNVPEEIQNKYEALKTVANKHKVDLRTAALQFCAAPKVVSAVIPGARSVEQARQNVESLNAKIPNAFWEELRVQKLIDAAAVLPASKA